jgi:hypothetical protein
MAVDAASAAGVPHRRAGARIASIDLLRGLIMALMARYTLGDYDECDACYYTRAPQRRLTEIGTRIERVRDDLARAIAGAGMRSICCGPSGPSGGRGASRADLGNSRRPTWPPAVLDGGSLSVGAGGGRQKTSDSDDVAAPGFGSVTVEPLSLLGRSTVPGRAAPA